MGCGARILSLDRTAPLGSLWDVCSARAIPLPAALALPALGWFFPMS